MLNSVEFKTNWVSAPGDTILDLLEEHGLSVDEFSNVIDLSINHTQKLIDGELNIDMDLAEKLADFSGSSISFWVNRETEYQKDVKRLRKTEVESNQDWLANLPVRDMIKFGWISANKSPTERIQACLDFFNVSSINDWHEDYQNDLCAVAFRTSETFKSKVGAVTAWLRFGSIQAEKIDCDNWDKEKLISKIPKLRALTKEADPQFFVPEIQKICASCGVAVVIAPAPNGCRASGATNFITDNKALILLSFRFKADDHFWFTFFHEIGHLILHDKLALFIEDDSKVTEEEEVEANSFSANILIPKQYRDEMLNLPLDTKAIRNARQVMRFAKKIGTSPGIVVGQLQYNKILPYNSLNKLKARYQWD